MELETYTFVLLRRGPRADEYSEAELVDDPRSRPDECPSRP
ncbi:MAG: hypothetical protein ACRDNH_08560 [Gaiellaceae bacterium]